MMLNLPDVTLISVTNQYPELTRMAIEDCIGQVKFGGAMCWSKAGEIRVPGVESLPVSITSVKDYDQFIWAEAWRHVRTSHFLIVQWDSWITNPRCWNDDFLLCDYIGAPWWYAGDNVGNSGFALCSRSLFSHISQFELTGPLDVELCRRYRRQLERAGFCWAPDELAHQFSFECHQPHMTFGFHAFRNWPFVLSEADLKVRLALCDESAFKNGQLEWFETNRREAKRRMAA